MKKIISNIISFVVMCLIVFIIAFISFEVSIRQKNIFKILDKYNYYEKSYQSFMNKISDYIINDEIKTDYLSYISKDFFSKDVRKAVHGSYNKKISLSRYDDFYKIIKKHTNDKTICKTYASNIDNIYINNLFPIKEMQFINNFYVETNDVLFITICLSSVALGLIFLIFLLNRNFNYFISLFSGSAFILILPLILKMFGIFKNFVYSNQHFTNVLLGIIFYDFDCLCVAFIILVALIIVILIKNKIYCKVNE